ncbi:hypothetical protein [Mobilicoccus sp.]|uniref:hypothetical protein n=1 Tax=Mobilicoccus sp. TaxID=2034349 RepID=UPI0028A8D8AF|nr:hypothetical protein [Mobilicoccus sp.]
MARAVLDDQDVWHPNIADLLIEGADLRVYTFHTRLRRVARGRGVSLTPQADPA